MIISISHDQLSDYVNMQINTFFPDGDMVNKSIISDSINEALERLNYCFSNIILSDYRNDSGEEYFNHINSNHYAIFLYFLSNTVWKKYQDISLATKIFLLNKLLHSTDIYYEVELPEIFVLIHPVGTILGRAKYGNYFVAYQGCTVGSLKEGVYPDLGEKVTMYSNSSILGNCNIGDNVVIGANTYLIDHDVSENKVVVGQYPNVRINNIKNNDRDLIFKL